MSDHSGPWLIIAEHFDSTILVNGSYELSKQSVTEVIAGRQPTLHESNVTAVLCPHNCDIVWHFDFFAWNAIPRLKWQWFFCGWTTFARLATCHEDSPETCHLRHSRPTLEPSCSEFFPRGMSHCSSHRRLCSQSVVQWKRCQTASLFDSTRLNRNWCGDQSQTSLCAVNSEPIWKTLT